MSKEEQAQQLQQQHEQAQQDQAAQLALQEQAFEAGFNGTELPAREAEQPMPGQQEGQQPTAEAAATQQQSDQQQPAADAATAQPAAQASAEGGAAAPATQPAAAQQPAPASPITAEDRLALVQQQLADERSARQKDRDTFMGKLGDVNRQLQELKKPAAEPQKLNLERTAGLNADVADALGQDLHGQLLKPEDVDQRIAAANKDTLAEVDRQVERRLLLRTHPDFFDQLETDEFKVWFGKLPEPDRKAFDASWDSNLLSQRMSEYKTWRQNAAQAVEQSAEKQRRLEAAVQTKGGKAPVAGTLTDEQQFEAGFQSVRGRRI